MGINIDSYNKNSMKKIDKNIVEKKIHKAVKIVVGGELSEFDLIHAGKRIFHKISVHILPADALDPDMARSLAAMVLTKRVGIYLAFLVCESQTHVIFQCRGIIWNANTYSCLPKKIQYVKG